MLPKTRGCAAYWLIGCESPKLCGENRLPVLRNVLQYVLHLHYQQKETIRDSCRLAVEALVPFFIRAGFETDHLIEVKYACDKLVKKFEEWIHLKKSMNRKTNPRREAFKSSLDKLFDLGRKDAMNLIKLEEDRAFYKSMKEDRLATMSGVDMKLARRKARKEKKDEGMRKLKRRSDEAQLVLFKKVLSDTIDDPAVESGTENEDEGMYAIAQYQTLNIILISKLNATCFISSRIPSTCQEKKIS